MTTLLANPADGFPSAGFENLLVPDTILAIERLRPLCGISAIHFGYR